jgi:hypothetical protein
MLGWTQNRYHKKHVRTCYAELGVLHPVRSCHIVHSGASRVQNVEALFFMLGWVRCRYQKQHTRASYIELVFRIRGDLRVT